MKRLFYVFFFQAEDGIRDLTVTGVQTCALPILLARMYWWGKTGRQALPRLRWGSAAGLMRERTVATWCVGPASASPQRKALFFSALSSYVARKPRVVQVDS